MNKKLYFIVGSLVALFAFVSSCSTDEAYVVPEEWKVQQRHVLDSVRELSATGVDGYQELKSGSNNGILYYKPSDSLKTVTARITKEGTPHVTDSVVCRYVGWFLDMKNKPVYFDSTEKGNGSFKPYGFTMRNVIVGWIDILQIMKVGDEYEICLPYQLGYGIGGDAAIPGYTTLFFKVKLLEIHPNNEGEFDE